MTLKLSDKNTILAGIETDLERAAIAIYDHIAPLMDKGLTNREIKKRYSVPGLNDKLEFESIEYPGERQVIEVGKALITDELLDLARNIYIVSIKDSNARQNEQSNIDEFQRMADLAAEENISYYDAYEHENSFSR